MKFGVADYGMGVWDGALYDLEDRLADLKKIGFDGIERLCAVSADDALNRAWRYRRMGMDFATCRGPSQEYGIEWTAGLGKQYVWIEPGPADRNVDFDVYCRRVNKFVAEASRNGLDAVLHNHLGSRIENQKELDRFMKACPDAKLLLDIGHLHGAGGDVVGTIRRYFKRIKAVHFKDIEMLDEKIGLDKWYQRLRFCELGGGNAGVPYEAAAKELVKLGYDGWVFVEHDTHKDEPVKELAVSLKILKKLFKK